MAEATRGREASKPGKSFRGRSRSRSRARKVAGGSRFKGLLKGISRKSSRAKTLDTASTTGSLAASTAVSIQQMADEKRIEEAPKSPERQAEVPLAEVNASLQLVLLLMDPATRRFELLQLEFDSVKARVSDIISQIPVSVTEAAIRQQKYEGVLDDSAHKMDENVHLVDFCSGKKILVALPEGLPVKECIRLARPILADTQVVKMLKGSGFDVSRWESKMAEEVPTTTSRALPMPQSKEITKEASRSKGSVFPKIAILALLAIVLQTAHKFISSPIEVGVALPPGTWRSKCGLLGYLPKLDLDFLPPQCTNSYLEVKDDGTVSVYGEDKGADMRLVGSVCNKEDCVDGIVMDEKRIVRIGGKRVKSVILYGEDSSLSPWPFQEAPKINVRAFNKAVPVAL